MCEGWCLRATRRQRTTQNLITTLTTSHKPGAPTTTQRQLQHQTHQQPHTKQAVVEAANAPTTAEGDAILRDRGVAVLPDVYANGGGIVASFFEWVQNLQNLQWDEEEVARRLDR